MNVDLNRLRVFFHVYAANSTIRAAEQLHISQPAVSQQIKKLEEEIKTPLFTRLHKKIVPTRAGHRLYRTVQPFLDQLACEIEHIATPMDRPYGPLHIGAPIIFGTTYLPGICHKFRAMYPDVRFIVKFGESDELLGLLNKGELNFVLIDFFSAYDQLPGRPEIYRIESLMLEHLILACSKAYYEDRVKGDLSFDHLASLEYLTDENDPMILRHWFWYYFNKKVANPNFVMAIEAHQALMACIRNGMGLAMTSHHLFAREIAQKEIIPIVPTPKEELINTISMVSLKDSVPSVTQTTFQSFLKARFDQTDSLLD